MTKAVPPLISVFTPSHKPRYLDDCHRSLRAQTWTDWEWVVVLNQGARWRPAVKDPRVKIVVRDSLTGVGAAKRLACATARGEILVELDHDDEMRSDALALVAAAFESHPEAGFVFSNTAQITEEGEREETRWNELHGWYYRDVDVDGRNLLQVDSLKPFPHNVSYIWYAPNHVRAFRAEAYDKAGGYDESRDILDDQDLMCRMYEITDFHHIDECLYLQRWHADNTQRDAELNARIQRETVALYDQYIQRTALAWSQRQGLSVLNLGPARSPQAGFVGVDTAAGEGVDLVLGPENRIDLPDSSVGLIRATDYLQRVVDRVSLFNEMYRVLAHGGLLLTMTPSTDGRGAFQDPTHVAFYNENSFWYFTDPQYSSFVPGLDCRFQVSRLVTFFPNTWHEENRISYVSANLIALKDGPRMGGISKF